MANMIPARRRLSTGGFVVTWQDESATVGDTSGGAGADIFWIRLVDGHDVIAGFNAAEGDRIALAQGLIYTVRANGAGEAVIVFSGGSGLTFQGFGLSASSCAIPASWVVRG